MCVGRHGKRECVSAGEGVMSDEPLIKAMCQISRARNRRPHARDGHVRREGPHTVLGEEAKYLETYRGCSSCVRFEIGKVVTVEGRQ